MRRLETGAILPKPKTKKKRDNDLITADHKDLNEGGEARNNHRCAVVVQDLATQGYNLIRAKRKLLTRRKGVYENSSSRHKSRTSFTHTPHRSETNGIAERATIKEGTSAVLLQSGLDKKWWADSMECFCYLRNVQDLLSDGKTPLERRCGEPLEGPVIPFGALVEYRSMSATSRGSTNVVRKFYLEPRICVDRGKNLET